MAASAALGLLTPAVTPVHAAPTAAVNKSAAAWQREGDRLLRAGNVKAAAQSYRRAATEAPREPLYQITSGVALASAGSTGEALAAFRRADKLFQGGNVLTALLLQGALSERADGAAEAQKLSARVVKRFSRPGGSGLDTTGSAKRLLRAQKQFGPSPILALLLGDVYQLANQWTKAEASYRQAIQLAPTWVKPRINQGLCWLAQGRSAQAISAFQGAIALDPANTQAQIAKADAQLQSGDLDDAVATYRKVENSPNNKVAAQAATGIGQAYAQRGQVSEAVRSLNRAQQLTPADPAPSVALGAVQSRAGNYSEAAKAYTEALQLSGGGLFASKGILYRALAETQLSARDSGGAIATVRRALTDEPISRPLWYRLWSEALYRSGDTSGGEARLKQALESEGTVYPQETLRAVAAHHLIPKLTADYTASLAAAADDAAKVRSLRALSALARFQKKFSDEASYRTLLVALRPSGAEWFALAEAKERNGDTSDTSGSVAAYRKAIALGGLTPALLQQAKARIRR